MAMTTLEVTLAEFTEINDRSVTMSDSEFAIWLAENFGDRCVELSFGRPVELKVVGEIRVEKPMRYSRVDADRRQNR